MISRLRRIRLGRQSAERLKRDLEETLYCPGSRRECREILARLAPYIAGAEDCEALEEALDTYFAWLGLRWAYEPCGPPPSTKKPLVLRALCSTRVPIPEELFKEVLGEEEGPGEEI